MNKKSTYEELEQKVKDLENKCIESEHLKKEVEKIFNLSLDMIGSGNLDGYFTQINSSFGSILGYTKEEFLEKPFIYFVHPEDLEETKKALTDALKGKQNICIENRYKCKDGSYKWIDWKVLSIVQEHKFIAVGRDITDRKQAEVALHDSQYMLHTVLDAIPTAVFWKNRDLLYLGGNRTWLAAAGLNSSKDVVGKSDYDLPWGKEQSNLFRQADRRVMESGMPEYNIIEAFRKADGSQAWASTNKIPLRDMEGNIIGIIGTYEDITVRKQAEEALKHEAIRRRILVDQSRDGIVVLDQNGKVYEANQRYADMLGYSLEEVHELYVWDWDFQWSKEQLLEMARTVDDAGDHFETRHRRKDGTIFDVEISTNGAVWGEQKLIFCVCRDITDRKRAEAALKESETRFRTLFEQAAVGVAQIESKTGRFVRINKRYCDIVGYMPDEMIRKSFPEITHPDDLQEDLDNMQQIIEGKIHEFSMEKRYFRKDGSVVWVNLTVSPMWENGQKPDYYIAVVEDISEKKQAEKELRIQEQLLNEMSSIAKIGGWEHDLTTDEATWTKETYKIVEIDESSPIPGPDEHLDYYPPEDRAILTEAYQRAMETGEPFDLDLRCTTAKGRMLWARAIGHPEFKDGQCVKMKGTFQDITDFKRTEKALRESEAKYRNLFENLYDVYYRADDQSIITLVSPSVEKHFGYTPDELIGQNIKNYFIDPQKKEEFISLLLKDGYVENFQVQLKHKNNSVIWASTNAKLIKDKKGGFGGVEGITRNVTYLKELEEQIRQNQKMESIGTLAGGIAHDFNNILGIILGNTELAIDDVPEWNPARMNLKEIRTASLRAKDVVRQLLSFARKAKLEKKPTDILPIIKESLKLLRSSIPTSTEIRQNLPEDIHTIQADPTQINQILINLCTNADHSMPDGGIILISAKNETLDEETAAQYPPLYPGNYVKLLVSDTGHGIPPEEIDRIFDPYFTTKEVDKGTGMGLAVVHGIVQGHNGLITVSSEPGKGTTFSIYFPAVEKEAVAATETDEQLPSGSERILFVDDEEMIVKLGRQRLERLGYKVEATTGPLEALDLFRSQPDKFDLVITDMTMPKMTGDKLVKEILNIRSDIPVILCTGFSEKIDKKEAKRIGAADYIEKPLDKRDFAHKVRKVLDARPDHFV